MAVPEENLTRDEARERAALLEDLHYDVQLDLAGGDETFTTSTTISFRCTQPGAGTFLDLTAEEIARVELNGRAVDLADATPTRVPLSDLAADNVLRVEATMRYQHEGRGLHFFRDPTDDKVYLHSQFEPFDAHLVYPCFDQPDLKATFDIAVDAPAGWQVVSNMAATEAPESGDAGRWTFATTPKLSPYVTAVVAGAYSVVRDRHGDVDLGIFCRASLADHLDTDELFTLTKQGLDWYAEAFDMAYPFGKYDQLFVPEFSAGAMENPGCVTFSEAYVFRSKVTDAARERRAETILHEMAHMWFGDLVTMRWWDDLWLNESFATFMSVLSQTEATRFTNAWVTFLDSEKAWAKFQDQLPSTHPIAADMVDLETVHQNFDGITYAKGASVLRQLVAWVGQDAFLAGCRRYFADHAYDNASLADFLGALEDASGRDLEAWKDEWLTTTGVNTLTADYAVDDGSMTSFAIVQEAADDHPTLRRHRVAVGLYALQPEGLVRTDRLELDVHGERTDVPSLSGRRAPDVVLVNDDDLTYAKLRLDPTTTATVTEHLDRFVEPLPRALVWSATWDMVRDGDLAARRFVSQVMANVAGETEVGVLERLLRRAVGAMDRYGTPDNRAALADRLADHAREQLEAAQPGSDHQLAWARHWAVVARRGEQLADVRRLLDGELTIAGLDVDTELRWHLITQLALVDAVEDAVIDTELARDDTDLGERHAATARAARPTAQAKETAFRRLIEEHDLSHTMSRQLIAGFNQLTQPDVLAPFTDRYFEALDRVWKERSLDWSLEFSGGMFPHWAAGEDLLAEVDEYLRREDLSRPLRRELLEQRDTLVRTIRARRRDAEV